MAAEMVTAAPHTQEMYCKVRREDASTVSDMLLDGIKAKAELDLIARNLQQAATAGMTAAQLLKLDLLPMAVDLDIRATAEMVQVLGMLAIAED